MKAARGTAKRPRAAAHPPFGHIGAPAAIFLHCFSCGGAGADGSRDGSLAWREVRVTDPAAARSTPPNNERVGYEYVARRRSAVVALAEARGIEAGSARRAIERLADAVDACTSLSARGDRGVAGAARVVVQVGADGTVDQASLRVDPQAGATGALETAAFCLLAPIKSLVLPPTDAGTRGMAIEALWGVSVGPGPHQQTEPVSDAGP
jgi:hypothetical protein